MPVLPGGRRADQRAAHLAGVPVLAPAAGAWQGGLLRTGTRATLNLLHIFLASGYEFTLKVSHARYRFECMFPLTLLPGIPPQSVATAAEWQATVSAAVALVASGGGYGNGDGQSKKAFKSEAAAAKAAAKAAARPPPGRAAAETACESVYQAACTHETSSIQCLTVVLRPCMVVPKP